MRIKNLGPAALTALATPALLTIDTQVASAQETAAERVVVTARRREESSQDVPIAITAFGAADIEAAGIERPQDFISLTPNVTLVETQNQGTSFLTMRGISQARNSEPSAAILVDGVLLTNPAQLTQELFDIQQIEVLKGPQGAVYGRNAIGGAIVITTREPGDQFAGRVKLGANDGDGFNAGISVGGPLGDSGELKYQASASYYDTDGWIRNAYLNDEADPFQDLSLRGRLIWDPSDRLRIDARYYLSQVETQAFYYNIVGFPSSYPDDVNITAQDIRVNNPGLNDRDLSQLSLKLDYDMDSVTFTSITSIDSIEEIMTGDQWDFVPIEDSYLVGLGFGLDDRAQHQYLDVDTFSQEFRFTSTDSGPLRWIGGVYFTDTERYISTGNIADRGEGAFPVYRTPRGAFPYDDSTYTNSFQQTFLADGQDNFAWAVFGETAYDLSDEFEVSFALRYDEDERKNTTLTPEAFLPADLVDAGAFSGEVRKKTWDELQPRITLTYKPQNNLTLYGGWGRGFRSGGFNQTGVGTDDVSIAAGVVDLFEDEVAETLEFGLKSIFADGRINLNFSVYDTEAEGGYFFVFLDASSTQNLGSLGAVDYQGYEIDVAARITDNLDLMASYGYTDSEITRDSPFKDPGSPTTVGNQAPLVTEDTFNVALQYHMPLGSTGLEFVARGDYERIGDTWWFPDNATVRRPVNLLDIRVGVQSDDWSIMAWGRNINDVKYNTEWSPGGFVFKAQPARYGVDFTKHF